MLSQSGVGSLAIDGGIAPSAWLSPLSMPSYLSAWESVMMSSSWLAIAAIAAPTCCEETDILVGGECSGKQTAIRKCAGTLPSKIQTLKLGYVKQCSVRINLAKNNGKTRT